MSDSEEVLATRPRGELSDASPVLIRRQASSSEHQLGVTDIWRTITRRKAYIGAITALVFVSVAVYTFARKPIYEGVSRLQIDPTRSSNLMLDQGDKSSSANVDSRIRTEVAIIQSNTVALQVMNSLKLYSAPQFASSDIIDRDITDISQLSASQERRLVDRFSENLTVRIVPDTQVIEIHFRSPDPRIASTVANSIIDEYMKRNFNARVNGTAQVAEWLSRQLDEIRSDTATAQEKLADFQRRTNFLGIDESNNIVTDRLKQLNEELTQAEADRIVKEGRYRLAESTNPELIASIVPGSTLQVLRTQEADLNAEYSQLNAKYGVGYPKLREVQAQLSQLQAAIDAESRNVKTRMGNELSAAEKAEAMLRNTFAEQKQAAYKLTDSAEQYAILKHEVESGQQLYDTLQLKLKEAGITSGLAASYIDVIDRAELPNSPVEPRKAFNLALGLGAGLFCGLLMGFAVDSFDDRVESSDQIEAITRLPELASIPYTRMLAKAQRPEVGPKMKLAFSQFNPICARDADCMAAEAYRSLCSVVLIASIKDSLKTLVVTSAMPDEGKSTVASNLATALAQRGRRVLLVDADLRCSVIQNRLVPGPGLSTILSEPIKSPAFCPLMHLPNLHVIAAGGRLANPMEVLDSARMRTLVADWREGFDHVIIDTPPALPFSDALTLSSMADAVILVARSSVSRAKALLRARDILQRSGGNIIGVVLNAVKHPEYFYAYPREYRETINRKYKCIQ